MRVFSMVGRSAFWTAPDGRRIFTPPTILARPYVVPNADIERRLLNREAWILWLMGLSGLAGLVSLGLVFQGVVGSATLLVSSLLGYVGLCWLFSYLALAPILRGLNRCDERIRHWERPAYSLMGLAARFTVALAFALLGFYFLVDSHVYFSKLLWPLFFLPPIDATMRMGRELVDRVRASRRKRNWPVA